MKSIIRFFVRHPIWSNVLMFSILGVGFYSALKINTSFFPESKSNIISIDVVYPGTSPEEIEKGIILKIEENLEGIEGIEEIVSVSSENRGSVQIFVFEKYNINELLTDVKNAVDRINSYPVGAEKPIVTINKFRHRTLEIAIYGEADLWTLKNRAEDFRDNLVAIDGISQVNIKGLPQREIAIEVSEAALRRYSLTFDDFIRAVKNSNVDISGGKLETKDEEILIRSRGKKYNSTELEKIVIKSTTDGSLLKIGDVATVQEKWSDEAKSTFYNGKRSIKINIDKTLDEDILFIAGQVKKQVELFAQKYPDLNIKIVVDRTVHLEGRIRLLQKNGLWGFIFVVLALSFFLNARLSFWVALGIPISFSGMFIVAYLSGITINVISLFGMIVVVGMLVDDAIVVAESVFQNHESGMSPIKAAIEGTMQVLAPVGTAVFTTIFVFIPFFFMEGWMGQIFSQVALVVVAALVFSLIESILILPAHLAHSKGLRINEKVNKPRHVMNRIFEFMRNKLYAPVLKFALNNKLVTIMIPPALLMITFGAIQGGFVGLSHFPDIPRDNFRVSVSLRTGSQEALTDSVLKMIEGKIWLLNKKLKSERTDDKDVILSVQRIHGSSSFREAGSHVGQLKVELLNGEERKLKHFLISKKLRKMVGFVPHVKKIEYGGGGRWGKAITISLLGNDQAQLKKASELLKEKLKEYSSLKDVNDNNVEGRREINIQLLPKAYALQLSVQEISRQIRQGFFGQEIQRLQRGRDEIRIWVRYKEEDRNSLDKFENMFIKMPGGESYPLRELVSWKLERGIVTIVHRNGQREIKVEADMENKEEPVPPILEEIKKSTIPEVLAQVQGVQVDYSGREKDNKKFSKWGKTTFLLGLAAVLVLLILVFRSYVQALIIFYMIPASLIGAALGHFAHDEVISRLSMYGIIALAGIIINDSIVYIDQINKNLKKGLSIYESVYHAGLSRFRPILLTTVTTVVGLAPIINETSRQAQYLIPMAISIAWGLAVGSILILFVVPSLFLVINSGRFYLTRFFRWQLTGVPGFHPSDTEITRESVEPVNKEKKINEELE